MISPAINPFRYRETTAAERHGKWRFVLTEDLLVRMPWRVPGVISFRDADGREWVRMDGSIRTIRAGYAWDGCSPKRHLPGIGWVGTPDPESTRLASCVHDAGYQFSGTRHFPLCRDMEDWLFLRILRAENFRYAGTYYTAVRALGWQFWGRHARPMFSEVIHHSRDDF